MFRQNLNVSCNTAVNLSNRRESLEDRTGGEETALLYYSSSSTSTGGWMAAFCSYESKWYRKLFHRLDSGDP